MTFFRPHTMAGDRYPLNALEPDYLQRALGGAAFRHVCPHLEGCKDGDLHGLPILGTDAVSHGYPATGHVYLCVQQRYGPGEKGP